MKIYSPQENYKLNKILMASKLYKKNMTFEKVQFDPKISKAFKQKYPQCSLPLLEAEGGRFIAGTNSILLFLAGQQALQNKQQKANIVQQLQRIQRQLDSATGILILQSKCYQQLRQGQVEKSKQMILKYLKEQNQKLSTRTFLVGDAMSVADISSFHNIYAIVQSFEKEIQKFKHLSRWMSHMESLNNL